MQTSQRKVQKGMHLSTHDKRIAELEAKIALLSEQVTRLTDLAARAQADLQNAKMRLERETGELRKFAAEATLQRLLPTIDNLERAFKHLPDDLRNHDWVKGIQALEQECMRELRDMGLQPMESLGKKADAARHEVLITGAGNEGTITEVFEEGYELHGKVIRPAKVRVGDGSA